MPRSEIGLVIVGASGDLTRRKLLPALARLHARGALAGLGAVIGTGRSALTHDAFRARGGADAAFAHRLWYHAGMNGLRAFVEARGPFRRVVVYLATPPDAYAGYARALHDGGFGDAAALVIEKPFGYDLASAQSLNESLRACFDEERIYRIDHYLAKEPVQNILVFRFANAVFYPVWNSRYIESIQINACETIDVEERGAYFDRAGIVRDMVQNHLLQLLCLLTMEAPLSLDPAEVRAQKLAVLKTLRLDGHCRRQYRGYRSEPYVAPDSATATYAELRLAIDSFRWSGMPIYVRCGKALDRRGTEIGVRFKALPRLLFNRDGRLSPNTIVFKIQPAEGIVLDLSSKAPGEGVVVRDTNMAFCYREAFGADLPEAYERLLLDALRGDRTLFVSAEETEWSWRVLEPALQGGPLEYYDRGTLPAPCLLKDWIDFGKYGTACAALTA